MTSLKNLQKIAKEGKATDKVLLKESELETIVGGNAEYIITCACAISGASSFFCLGLFFGDLVSKLFHSYHTYQNFLTRYSTQKMSTEERFLFNNVKDKYYCERDIAGSFTSGAGLATGAIVGYRFGEWLCKNKRRKIENQEAAKRI